MELIRKIIVPTSNFYVLKLPERLIGKQVEVIAYEIENKPISSADEKIKRFNESLMKLKTDLSNFKFDRDEANNYDE